MSWPSDFKTIEEARAHRYGCWGGNPRGRPYAEGRCAESVSKGFALFGQCERKNGYGPSGLFCKQHDPDARKAKQEAQRAKWKADEERQKAHLDARILARQVADLAIEAFAQRASFDALEKLTGEYAAAKAKAEKLAKEAK